MKIYLTAILALLITGAIYGAILPSLVSAHDTIAVIVGIVLFFLYPAGLYAVIKKIFKKKERKDEH